jgi:hypothetical protein
VSAGVDFVIDPHWVVSTPGGKGKGRRREWCSCARERYCDTADGVRDVEGGTVDDTLRLYGGHYPLHGSRQCSHSSSAKVALYGKGEGGVGDEEKEKESRGFDL